MAILSLISFVNVHQAMLMLAKELLVSELMGSSKSSDVDVPHRSEYTRKRKAKPDDNILYSLLN